jgi:hypothetical protein
MIKRFAAVAGVAILLLAAGSSTVAASRPKPLGYIYGQCTTKTTCLYQASTTPQQNKISISVSTTGFCVTGAQGVSQAGFAKVKRNGKFSISKTVSVENADYQKSSVHVQISGTLKPGKKATGSLEITTSSTDCAADTGVKKSFNMKYEGPSYGG